MNDAAEAGEPGRPGSLLAGVVVLDLTRHLPGPLAVRLLRDLGARTIKIEAPGVGDPVREAPPFFENGDSALARAVLGGCESVVVDLATPAGIELVELLAASVDVVIESSRPGQLERRGLSLARLRERYPRLITCSLSGWGASGEWASRSGHDLTYQAAAGLLGDHMPVAPLADALGAWAAVATISAALVRVRGGGDGAAIDLGLADVAAHANLVAFSEIAATGHSVQVLAGRFPCYRLYRCRDGRKVALAALEPHFWERFCRAASRPDLERHQYDADSGIHREVEALFARRTARAWLDEMFAIDVPIELVATAEEALTHPWLVERGLVATDGGRVAFPVMVDHERLFGGGSVVPPLGEDGARVLAERLDHNTARRLAGVIKPRRGLGARVRGWWLRRKARKLT